MGSNWYQSVNTHLPQPFDPEKSNAAMSQFCERISALSDPEIQNRAQTIINDDLARPILECLFGNSPYLTTCIINEPGYFCHLLSEGPDIAFNMVMQGLEVETYEDLSFEGVQEHLRIAKRQASLAIALGDITHVWQLAHITHALTTLAEKTLDLCVGYLLYEGHKKGHHVLDDPVRNPQKNSGLIVLGMGKMGGFELNYSSDIDLIVLFDPAKIKTDDRYALGQNMVRLCKKMIQLMEERTKDGYVFRTDLRLRPDPGSTPLALSVIAAETYYESIGQTWERAAMIKARPVAGDLEAGYAFLDFLKPFMWRKYMDFAALQDIHNIKRQINAHKGGRNVCLACHNVKLGPGGIREIEFFAQTQQLIWGGRIPELRIAPTCQALKQLVYARQCEPDTCDTLIASYEFLRTVEHRLQMINDEQTHTIPDQQGALERLSVFLGYHRLDDFEAEYISHLNRVEAIYAELFEEDRTPEQASQLCGNLVFTGSESDPSTLKTLKELGFSKPDFIDQSIRGWHHARYRATKSKRGREILTEIMESLLLALSKTVDPDMAFVRFDRFLSKLPAGIQLFSLFKVNPLIMDLVAEVMGEAPRLSEHLATHPGLLEFVLTPDFFKPLPPGALLQADLETRLEQARDFQDILDIARRWTNDRKFQIGVQTLRNIISVEESLAAQTQIADCILQTMLDKTKSELETKHGLIENSDFCILAFGKAGSRELSATSDLDLVFIYDVESANSTSNGERPLGAGQYFTRLSQRFINNLTAPTGEGMLYEVDMRLRPSGNAGPIAASLEAFKRYYREAAWTWEYMALSRARVISAKPELKSRIETCIQNIIRRPRDCDQLLVDVTDMRTRMAKEHVAKTMWSLKHYRGGIVDVDFICQYLVLKHAHSHPEIICANSLDVLKAASRLEILTYDQARELSHALQLWNLVQGYLRLTMGENLGDDLPEALKEDLVRAANETNFESLCQRMQKYAQLVRGHYETILTRPADQAKENLKNGDKE